MRGNKAFASHPLWQLVPLAGMGMGLYLVLYLVAAQLYPGGSQADMQASGFSWRHNYWCNLLQAHALNGAPNPARPVALSALLLLGASLAMIWYQLPAFFAFAPRVVQRLQLAGLLSMGSALFVSTPYHDLVLNVAGFLGTFAFAGTLVGLYRARQWRLFSWGLSCVGGIALNNLVYYTHQFLYWLPLLQKLTLLLVLLWLGRLNWLVYEAAKLTYLNKRQSIK